MGVAALHSPSERQWRTLGAIVGERGTTFRVWAPGRREVAVVLQGRLDAGPTAADLAAPESPRVLRSDRGGWWTGTFEDVGPGALYKLRLDGAVDQTFPDPASRYQPLGVHGPSAVVDPDSFPWTDDRWVVPAFD